MKRKPPRVEIDWLDAVIITDEREPDDLGTITLALRTTEGRLIHENESRILVASTRDTQGRHDGIWVIPVNAIQARRYPGRRAPKVRDGEAKA